MKCHQQRLINLNCFETGLLAELSHFSKRLCPQCCCIQPFFSPLSFLAWWNALFIAIYPLSALFRHTVSSPAEERLFVGCQSRPITRWQSICCCWSGMSNGITTVLITSAHTCTPPCATHLIAPRQLHPCYRPWYLPHFPWYGMSITAFVGSDLYLLPRAWLQHFWHRECCSPS